MTALILMILPVTIGYSAPLVGPPPVSQSQEPSQLTIVDIIENVRRNEGLYENIEYVLRQKYAKTGRPEKWQDPGMKEVVNQETTLRVVSQSGMFRLERGGWDSYEDSPRTTRDRTRAFDGTTTRLFDQNAIGNIITGKAEESFFRPHMLLIQHAVGIVPLSTFMQGHQAMAAYPGSNSSSDVERECTYQGEAEFQGLKCYKVWITSTLKSTGQPHGRWELWVAEARNYLPVRYFAFTFRWSKDIPKGEGVVDEFKEIAPGLWFPVAAHCRSYDVYLIQREGRQQEAWRQEYAVDQVKLNPNYDKSFFGNVTFPNGTAVYEIENGKILKSYVQGGPATATNAGWHWHWIIAVNIGVASMVGGFLLLRRFTAHTR